MRTGAGAIGRAARVVGRIALWSAIALLLVRGAVDVVAGDDQPDRRPISATRMGDEREADRFDGAAAEAFAVRFAIDYLTFAEQDPAQRRDVLARYLAPHLDVDAAWNSGGTQSVRHALPVQVATTGQRAATVLVAVQLEDGRWLHLAVPIVDGGSGFAVAAMPALVPTPEADPTVEVAGFEPDVALSSELRPTLEGFFRAYAGGAHAELERYVLPGTALRGLDGGFAMAELAAVSVAAGDSAHGRPARVTVRWVDSGTGATFSSTYELALIKRDGRWYVARLQT